MDKTTVFCVLFSHLSHIERFSDFGKPQFNVWNGVRFIGPFVCMYVCMCMWGKMADGPGGLASTVIYFVALLLRGWRKFRRVFPDNMGSDTIQTAIKEALRTEKIRETKTQWKLKFTRWRMSTRCSAITLNVLTSPASVTGLDKWKTEWSTTSSRNVNNHQR